jgi:hypothetical protein
MRAPFITSLLAAAWFAGVGCNSAPQQDPPAASHDRACANAAYDPLHMVSSKVDTKRDPDIESLLNQSADPRLAWVNRQMYLSLRSLDMELSREQRVAECEHPQSTQVLEARSGGGAGAGEGAGSVAGGGGAGAMANRGAAGGGAGSAADGGADGGGASAGGIVATTTNSGAGSTSTSAVATASSAASQSSIAGGTTTGTARSTLVRKSSLSASGAGGNGAIAQKISVGSDNDIVARRLRKAAEQETDPALRAKLWKEYTDFRQGMSAK